MAGDDDGRAGEADAVLIIGAGSTGLALAQGLAKAGIPSSIFEKHPQHVTRERDWNMGLHWGAPVLQSLIPTSLWSQLQSVQVDPNEPTKEEDPLVFLNAATGERMAAVTVSRFYRLRRSKLRALLMQGLDIRYGKQLTSLSYSGDGAHVTAHFDDGTSATGRLLVGADGARSAVRRSLLGPEKAASVRLPFAATFVQARFPRETALFLRQWHPLYLAGIHPRGYFAFFGMHDAPDPADPSSWTFFFYISWASSLDEQDATAGWSNAQRLAQVREMGGGFAEPWRTAFASLPHDHPVWYMGMTEWDPGEPGHRWGSEGGRVTLAGDAAHTMTYQRGQGLNHSITDAGKLCEVIQGFWGEKEEGARERRREAVESYEREMVERSGAEVRISTANTAMLHNWEQVKESPVFKSGMNKST